MRRRQTGIALLLSLLVLTILIALVGQMTITATHNRSVSKAALAGLQNTYGVRAAYHHAALYLRAHRQRSSGKDTLHDPWAGGIGVQVGESSVQITIRDASSRVNLSMLVGDDGKSDPKQVARLSRLARNLGHSDEVVKRIVDYIDKDSVGQFELGARNERLLNMEELLRIPGMEREVLYGSREPPKEGILEYITMWPRKGGEASKTNINTASVPVLMSLHDDMTETIAQNIVSYRNTQKEDGTYQDFGNIDDLKKVEGMTEELFSEISSDLTIKAEVFEIHARSSGVGAEKAWVYVVAFEQDKIDLRASMQENDFLWVQPPEEEEE